MSASRTEALLMTNPIQWLSASPELVKVVPTGLGLSPKVLNAFGCLVQRGQFPVTDI